jgi:hypothetical protein
MLCFEEVLGKCVLSVFDMTSVFFRECFLALCMFMRRNASALGTAKPAVLLSGVATPRAEGSGGEAETGV